MPTTIRHRWLTELRGRHLVERYANWSFGGFHRYQRRADEITWDQWLNFGPRATRMISTTFSLRMLERAVFEPEIWIADELRHARARLRIV
jgi:hypothetical protein